MRSCAIWQVTLIAMIVACELGCGGGLKKPKIKLVSAVGGTITLDEQPLEGATVAFIPYQSKQSQPSFGYSDAVGKYKLQTTDGDKGIAEGEYRIVVSKLVQPDGTPIPRGSQTGGADGLELVPFPHCHPRQTQNIAVVTKEGGVFDVAIVSGGNTDTGQVSRSREPR